MESIPDFQGFLSVFFTEIVEFSRVQCYNNCTRVIALPFFRDFAANGRKNTLRRLPFSEGLRQNYNKTETM